MAASNENLVPGTVYVSFSSEISQNASEALLATVAELVTRGVQNVYLLLSTPGGSVMNGITLYNTLRAMPIKLTTHNMGAVNSVGNLLFLAGEKRYSSLNATFMFHGVGFDITSGTRLEQKNLRERLDSIAADETKIGAIIADRTALEPKEVAELFREAAAKDPDYALSKGIVHEIRDIQIPQGSAIQQLVFER